MDNPVCCMKKKSNIRSKRASNVDLAKVIIVKTEIESWYLAGLNYSDALSLNVTFRTNTEGITKEIFRSMVRSSFSSNIDFMVEVLNKFSIDTAKNQNSSFLYFCSKFL